MKIYQALNFKGLKRSYASKFLFIAFLGTHIPLIGLVLFSFLYPQNEISHMFVIILILAYTLVAAIFTLYVQNKLLAPIRMADKAMEEFKNANEIIDIPDNYNDEAGRLLSNIKETLTKTDRQNKEIEMHRNKLEKLVAERTSDLKTAKERAEESDRLKSSFLATMSHELRTPLNHILGFSSMMDEDAEKEEMITYASAIYQSGQNLLNIIEDILYFSTYESSEIKIKKKPISLSELFYSNKTILEENIAGTGKSNLKVELKPQKELMDLHIHSDEFMINQVLLSLFKNAVKFTKEGFIEFGCYSKEGKGIVFYVKDTGIGIPADKQQVIFDYFRQLDDTHTRQHEGIGLGLSISQKVVDILGGKLLVESEEGKGSIFSFVLPNKPWLSEAKPDEQKVKSKKGSKEKEVILIVEDDEMSRSLMEIKLKRRGIRVHTATNGREALHFLSNNPDTGLVFMDLKMPVMDGYQATRKIREINPDISIVALSAYVMKFDREKALESGCNDFMPKPVHNKQLDLVLEKYM